MSRVLVLQHGDGISTGYLGDALEAADLAVDVRMLHRGDAVPGVDGWDAVVSLGGVMGAYEEEAHPFLVDEKSFLADAVEAGLPVLGICLGCQLLADTLGGRAYRAEGGSEIAVQPVTLTSAGRTDPVVSHLTGPVLVWHGDTWDLPPGAVLLADTEAGPQAFRFGSAIGIQPHPEASPEMLGAWMETDEAKLDLEAHGVDRRVFAAEIEAAAEVQRNRAGRLFGAWVATIP